MPFPYIPFIITLMSIAVVDEKVFSQLLKSLSSLFKEETYIFQEHLNFRE